MKWLGFGLTAALLAITPIDSGAGMAKLAVGAPVSPTESPTSPGRKIYNFRCYFCHGYSGNAQTVAASFLTPPPVDFTRADAARFTPEHIVSVLQNGKPGTAMQSFRSVLSNQEMQQVAEFIIDEFISHKAVNTRYHTPENGWFDHQRYKAAFPFATGEIPLSRPWEQLSAEQTRGKHLFMSSCVVCHARGRAVSSAAANTLPDGAPSDNSKGITWETAALSYPRNNFSNQTQPPLDAMTSASPYLLHEMPPQPGKLTTLERRGEKLFQANCAFCHAADGTGKNWIGSFLQPHPRNLRDPAFMNTMTRARLAATIREGLPNTSMPAWKSVLGNNDIAAIVAYIAKAFHPLPD